MDLNRVVLQSNNEVLIQTMIEGRFSATNSSTIFYDCDLRANRFDEVKFAHCPREANMAAHKVSRFVSLSYEACTWVDEPP